jgi:TonB family protein
MKILQKICFVLLMAIFLSSCSSITQVYSGDCFKDKDVDDCRVKAEQGNDQAQYVLGKMYYKGQGVPQDYQESAKWYRKSSEQGNSNSQLNLGMLYETGKGVPQNHKESVKWYRKSAEKGNSLSQYILGNMYFKGQGVPQDYKQTVKWWKISAEQGHQPSQYNLGNMYYKGMGVPKDYVMAYIYWNLASVTGDESAIKNRDIVEMKMTPSQLEKALNLEGSPSRSNRSSIRNANVYPLVRVAPRYPMRAAKQHIEGWVKVQFTITKEGKVSNIIVVDSNPKHVFDRAALIAIKQWKFKPAIIRGILLEQRAEQLLEFKLPKPTSP